MRHVPGLDHSDSEPGGSIIDLHSTGFLDAAVPLAVLDGERRIAAVNAAWCRRAGGAPEQWRGRAWANTGPGADDELAGAASLVPGDAPIRQQRILYGLDAVTVRVGVMIAAAPGSRVMVALDTTGEVALAELELLASAISHDLRQESRMVAAYAGLVAHRHAADLPEAGRTHLAEVAAHAVRLQRRIGLVALHLRLLLARPAVADCGTAWAKALALHRALLPAEPPAAPPLPQVLADPDRLHLVLGELLRSVALRGAQPAICPAAEGPLWRLSLPSAAASADPRLLRLFAGAQGDDDAAGPALAQALAQMSGGRVELHPAADGTGTLHLLLPAWSATGPVANDGSRGSPLPRPAAR